LNTITRTLSSVSSIFTTKTVQMNDVWASYDSKNYVLKKITLSIAREIKTASENGQLDKITT